jgi:hypothetical protein
MPSGVAVKPIPKRGDGGEPETVRRVALTVAGSMRYKSSKYSFSDRIQQLASIIMATILNSSTSIVKNDIILRPRLKHRAFTCKINLLCCQYCAVTVVPLFAAT